MHLADILFHLLNFVAPALAGALVLPFAARWALQRKVLRPGLGLQMLLLWTVGMGVLFACLLTLAHDGKMVSYGALVLVQASVQWILMRGWRR